MWILDKTKVPCHHELEFAARDVQKFWLEAGGKHNPRASHHIRPCDFLSGMVAELVGRNGGGPAGWLWDPLEWPVGPKDATADLLAYAMYEARDRADGRHNRDKNGALWLLGVAERAVECATSAPCRTHDHFLQAIGVQFILQPKETLRAFYG